MPEKKARKMGERKAKKVSLKVTALMPAVAMRTSPKVAERRIMSKQ